MSDEPSPQPPQPPPSPEPLTPAQQRTRRAQQTAVIRRAQTAGYTPRNAPPLPPGVQPGRKAFAVHEVKRLPVLVSDAARALIDASSSEGRIFPQALAEAFAPLAQVDHLEVDVVPKSRHFPVHPSELHPLTGAEPFLLVVEVFPTADAADSDPTLETVEKWRYTLNARDLSDLHPVTRMVCFQAANTALDLARLSPFAQRISKAPMPASEQPIPAVESE